MIGLIQKILLELVEREGGAKALADVTRRAGLAEVPDFRIDTDYPDDECLRLIEATQAVFGLDEEALYRLYADAFIVESRRLFPMFYRMSPTARDFLERQPRVHDTLASSLRNEASRERVRDKFAIRREGEDLVVTYGSPNRLCGLYEALFDRLLQEYGEAGELSVRTCQKRGDPVCTFCLRTETAID